MNTTKPSDKRVPLFTLLVFLAVLILAVVFQDVLRTTVLTPILYLFWIGNLAYQSVDQRCIWVAALLIVFALNLAFFRRAKKPAEVPPPGARRAVAAGRIRFWQAQLQAQRGASYEYFSVSEIHRLVTEVLAYRDHIRVGQIKEQMQAGQLEIPAELRAPLGLEPDAAAPPVRWPERIRQWWAGLTHSSGNTSRPDPQLEQVADYMESLMEVENDIRNR